MNIRRELHRLFLDAFEAGAGKFLHSETEQAGIMVALVKREAAILSRIAQVEHVLDRTNTEAAVCDWCEALILPGEGEQVGRGEGVVCNGACRSALSLERQAMMVDAAMDYAKSGML